MMERRYKEGEKEGGRKEGREARKKGERGERAHLKL